MVLTACTAQAVQNRDVRLDWATASEANNAHFEVERSLDGVSFVKVATVASYDTTTTSHAYSLTDAGVAAKATGPVYYYLRQVDLDGTSAYSPVQAVSFNKPVVVNLTLAPNPTSNRTILDLSALPATGSYQVLVLDATGRTVLSTMLAVTSQATGTYHVVVTGT